MKVAFFDPTSGHPVRIFSGAEADAEMALADPRYAGFPTFVLDGTPYADAMSLHSLAELMIGGALAGAPVAES